MAKNYKIILGSQSPRRSSLLKQMGFEFEIKTLDFDESYPSDTPIMGIAPFIARKKAFAFSISEEELIITADSVVIFDNTILGKPKDEMEARLF